VETDELTQMDGALSSSLFISTNVCFLLFKWDCFDYLCWCIHGFAFLVNKWCCLAKFILFFILLVKDLIFWGKEEEICCCLNWYVIFKIEEKKMDNFDLFANWGGFVKLFFFGLTRVNPSNPWHDHKTKSITELGFKTIGKTIILIVFLFDLF